MSISSSPCATIPVPLQNVSRSYETFYYYNRRHNFNITFSVLFGPRFHGSHVPMGYRNVAERDPAVLFADRHDSLAWGGAVTPSGESPTVGVATALLAELGQVDELVVSVGGAWPNAATNPGMELERRIALR